MKRNNQNNDEEIRRSPQKQRKKTKNKITNFNFKLNRVIDLKR